MKDIGHQRKPTKTWQLDSCTCVDHIRERYRYIRQEKMIFIFRG